MDIQLNLHKIVYSCNSRI